MANGKRAGNMRFLRAGSRYLPLMTLALLLLLSFGDASAGSCPFFAAPLDFETGLAPLSVAIGDLNADGKPDLAVASESGYLSVLLGNGDGTFGSKTDYVSGTFVAIGDLNADGKPDLAAANSFSDSVSVLLGNGDGTFGTRTRFGVGSDPSSVAIGDLNADGKPDLAVANEGSMFPGLVSVLLGNGDGTFGLKTDFDAGFARPRSVAIGDLNADGKPDLAVAIQNDRSVSVLLGNGDGSFGPGTDYDTGIQPWSVAIGDLNADGNPDLAVSNTIPSSGSSSTVSVLLGNGDGTFGLTSDFETGAQSWSVAIGDLNADGKPDLAVANGYSDTVSVLRGNGDGTFRRKTDFGTGTWAQFVAIGDLNADGKPDLAVANWYSSTVTVLLNIKVMLAAAVNLEPNSLNLTNRAPWLTAYIEPVGFDPANIDISTLRLACLVPASNDSALVGDHDGNGLPDLRVRFSRQLLDPFLTLDLNSLELTGSLLTGERFEGTGEVRVVISMRQPIIRQSPE